MRSLEKSIRFKHCALFFSLPLFLHSFPLFSMVCGLFCKYRGGGIQTFWNTIAGLLRMAFHEEARLGDGQNGGRRGRVASGEDYAELGGALAARGGSLGCYFAGLSRGARATAEEADDDFHSLPDVRMALMILVFAG